MAERKPSEVLGGWHAEVIEEIEDVAEGAASQATVLTDEDIDELIWGDA